MKIYKTIKPKFKRMDGGGDVDDSFGGLGAKGFEKSADFLSDSLGLFNQPGKANVGVGAAQGALKGAALGTSILPGIGTGVGAVVGGVSSLITGLGNKKALDAEALQKQKENYNAELNRSNAALSSYNTMGTTNNQFYARGGKIMPKYNRMAEGGNTPTPKKPVIIDSNTGVELPTSNDGNVDLGYSRVYGSRTNLSNNNIQALRTFYAKDPSVLKILNRNIAPKGEVPMYGSDDGDAIKQLLGQYQKPLQVSNIQQHYAKGGSIHIKPSHKGRFTAYKERTGETTEEALHSKNPHVRQMANFARNAAKWKHADGGTILDPDYEAEKDEVVQGNPQLEESTELASDMHKVGGDTHENGGTMGIGGDRVFSDRLKISPILQEQLRAMKIPIRPNSTYADVTTKLGSMKGKYEDKLDSSFVPTANTGKKMIGRLNDAIEQTFQDQELQKKVISNSAKDMSVLAYGGKLKKYGSGGDPRGHLGNVDLDMTGLNSTPSEYTATPLEAVNPNSNDLNPNTLIHPLQDNPIDNSSSISTNDGESILSRIGKGIDDNQGQLTNAGVYLANLGSINRLNTSVRRNYLANPVYNYTNRSGQAIYDNNKTFNTTLKSLTGSSSGVNGSNVGALYGSTLEANNRINREEATRKDNYDNNYNDRADKISMINNEISNSANDATRDLYNQKFVALPTAARNAFLQGIMGNNQVKANNKAQQTQMKIAALLFDKNNVLSRYGSKLKNAGLDIAN